MPPLAEQTSEGMKNSESPFQKNDLQSRNEESYQNVILSHDVSLQWEFRLFQQLDPTVSDKYSSLKYMGNEKLLRHEKTKKDPRAFECACYYRLDETPGLGHR